MQTLFPIGSASVSPSSKPRRAAGCCLAHLVFFLLSFGTCLQLAGDTTHLQPVHSLWPAESSTRRVLSPQLLQRMFFPTASVFIGSSFFLGGGPGCHEVHIWVWVKIKAPGYGPQVLVLHVSVCQGAILSTFSFLFFSFFLTHSHM